MIGRVVSCAPMACLALAAQSGLAQTVPSQPGPAPATNSAPQGIGDIVVTAQRRSESAQRVPAAITAISGDTLAKLGVTRAEALTTLVPSLNVATQNGNVLIGIRGIYSITATVANGSPEIAVSADGVYQSRAQTITGTFFDISRIEVLRGPQGTLYGRNATGGSVNIITNKPSPDAFGAQASLDVGNYATINSSGAVNIPLSGTTAVRAAFFTQNHDGYLGKYYDDADRQAARVELLSKPTSTLSVFVSAYGFHEGGHGGSDVISPFVTSHHWDNTVGYPLDGKQNNHHWGVNAQVDWDIGPATLTYLPAFIRVGQHLDPYYSDGFQTYTDQVSKQYSQELRLASNDQSDRQGNLKWVGGLYWLKEDQTYHLVIPAILQNVNTVLQTQSYAAFGQGVYGITDKIRLTAGLRYTHDDSNQVGTGSNLGTPTPIGGSTKSSNVGWRVGIDANVARNSLLFASAASGYKAGGEWSGGVTDNTFRPETLVAYEVGSKNRLFDNRFLVNISGFYYNYKGYQATTIVFLPGSGFVAATYNAGSARVYGAELESIWKPTANDQIDFNLTLENAYFRNFLIPPTTDLSGNKLPSVSHLTISGGVQHSFSIGDTGRLTARVHSKYTSRYYADFYNSLPSRQNGFTSTEASLEYSPTPKWSLTAYVRNIENVAVKTYVLTGITSAEATIGPPRTFGIRADVRF